MPDDAAEYLEFLWGDWLRGQGIALPGSYDPADSASYLAAVRTASQAMSAVPGDTVIADGRTADQLGKLTPWNSRQEAHRRRVRQAERPDHGRQARQDRLRP